MEIGGRDFEATASRKRQTMPQVKTCPASGPALDIRMF